MKLLTTNKYKKTVPWLSKTEKGVTQSNADIRFCRKAGDNYKTGDVRLAKPFTCKKYFP